jgi:hypothetical protein
MRPLRASSVGALGVFLAVAAVAACVGDAPDPAAAIDAGSDAVTNDGPAPDPDGGVTSDAAADTGANADTVMLDLHCKNLALAALKTDKFAAWISGSNVNAIDRVADVPYYLVDGTTQVVASKAGLKVGLVNAIKKDEKGVDVTNGTHVWTGTRKDGEAAGNYCDDWNAAGGAKSGMAGVASATDTTWTESDGDDCNIETNRVYCFEQ